MSWRTSGIDIACDARPVSLTVSCEYALSGSCAESALLDAVADLTDFSGATLWGTDELRSILIKTSQFVMQTHRHISP